jgi:hypothetical protein
MIDVPAVWSPHFRTPALHVVPCREDGTFSAAPASHSATALLLNLGRRSAINHGLV